MGGRWGSRAAGAVSYELRTRPRWSVRRGRTRRTSWSRAPPIHPVLWAAACWCGRSAVARHLPVALPVGVVAPGTPASVEDERRRSPVPLGRLAPRAVIRLRVAPRPESHHRKADDREEHVNKHQVWWARSMRRASTDVPRAITEPGALLWRCLPGSDEGVARSATCVQGRRLRSKLRVPACWWVPRAPAGRPVAQASDAYVAEAGCP